MALINFFANPESFFLEVNFLKSLITSDSVKPSVTLQSMCI